MSEVIKQLDALTDTMLGHVKKRDKDLDAMRERIEILEAKEDRPRGTSSDVTREDREHKERFLAWVRRPGDGSAKRMLDEAQSELENKSGVAVGSNASGGYAVPKEIQGQVEKRVVQLNPFRGLVKTVQAGTRDYNHLASKNQAGSGWVGEGDSRTETATSDLIDCAPTFGTLYAYPKASEESMQDIFFDVQSWLVDEIADGFSAAEATAIVSGNGTKKPSGFLNTSPSSSDDNASPERAATALQYLGLNSSPLRINADALIDLMTAIKEGYLLGGNVAWVMRRSTAALIHKLKDSYGQYIWQPSLQAGQPNQLLGYPVALTDAMPAASANQYPIAFGNWSRGYLLVDRVGTMRITIDDNITTPGYVKFYCRKVVGGKVLNNEAIKVQKFA